MNRLPTRPGAIIEHRPLDLTSPERDGPHDFTRAYAATSHGQLHYAEHGRGEPLILLAETPRSHRYFRKLMRPLGKHFRVLALDTPGFGHSHPLPEPLTIPAIASCVIAFADALGLQRFSVMGTNTGDKVAIALGAEWPDRIDRLVLCGYTHSLIPEKDVRDAALAKYFETYHPSQYDEDSRGAYLVRRWTAAQATLATDWWPKNLLTGGIVEPQQLAAAEAVASDFVLGWRSAIPVYEAVFAFDLVAAASRVAAPTLLLEMSSDEEARFGPQAERLAALMPNATAARVAVTLGSAMETEAGDIADAVLRFLSATPARRPATPQDATITQTTLTLLEPPPAWFVDGFLGEIDAKTFGDRFEACFAPGAQMWFGESHLPSFADIKAHLQQFDSTMDTHHVVEEFWDAPHMKVVLGRLTFTPHASGATETTRFVHLLRMSREDPDRIEQYHGAAGPADGL